MLSSLGARADQSCNPTLRGCRKLLGGPAGLRPVARGLIAAACALCCGGAVAGPGDALHPFASLGYSYDDNLFRLGDGNPGYDNTRGDRSTQLQAGLLFDKTYGRQNISLQAKVSRVSFSHFTALDYNGKDMLAD